MGAGAKVLRYSTKENGLSGQVIQLETDNELRLYRPGDGTVPIGILARKVRTGEVLKYNPLGNTKDIVTTTNFKEIEL